MRGKRTSFSDSVASPGWRFGLVCRWLDTEEQRLPGESAKEIFHGDFSHFRPRLLGRAAQVRGDRDVVQRQQWMVARQRLRISDVKRGGVDLFFLQGLREGGRIDDR